MPTVRAGEIELDYERSGSGPPLFLIMGMSGTALTWGEPFLELLRRDFEVIVYDHRGVGVSSPLTEAITITQLAEDASALLSALELDSAHVLGISMGGMIGQELALKHPGQVRTLALGCTYCGGPDATEGPPWVLQRLSEGMMSGDRELALRTAWEVNVSNTMAQDAIAYAAFLAISEQRAVAVPVIMAQLQACVAHDTSARLHELTVPTLVIHGTDDLMLPVENGRQIASLIPGSKLEIFDGVGHLFFWERPERAAELVRSHAAVPA
ncbi:MAG TPA: alpha/beta fold hydrolase [Solirubrobacteraceae bacterium]|nr:alpha/beta fold hydrolase [Solirubrobacteraceae bacterium]